MVSYRWDGYSTKCARERYQYKIHLACGIVK